MDQSPKPPKPDKIIRVEFLRRERKTRGIAIPVAVMLWIALWKLFDAAWGPYWAWLACAFAATTSLAVFLKLATPPRE